MQAVWLALCFVPKLERHTATLALLSSFISCAVQLIQPSSYKNSTVIINSYAALY
jgi:hypothetical protein